MACESIIHHQLPITNHQASIRFHHSSCDRQSAIINNRQSISHNRQSIINNQLIKNEYSIIIYEQSIINIQRAWLQRETPNNIFYRNCSIWGALGGVLGGALGAPGVAGMVNLQKVIHLSAKTQKLHWNVNFTMCFWGYVSPSSVNYNEKWLARTDPHRRQGPLSKTYRENPYS